jgi:hypothetical protein
MNMHKHHIYRILAAGLLLAGNAFADVIWSREQNLSGYEQYIDLNNDSLTDVILAYEIFIPDILYSEGIGGVLRAYIDNSRIDGSNQILVDASNGLDAALTYGTLISGTPDSSLEWKGGRYASGRVSYWSTRSPEPDTEWRGLLGETGEAYVGIAFDVGASTHYGWVHVTLGEVDPTYGFKNPITANWAYESTPDTPIVAGVIPEPSTGILTMVGSLGLLLHARSRRNGKPTRLPRLPTASPPPEEW